MSYSDFQNQASSEKITLAILHASKRLMGWTLYSGSIYSISVEAKAIESLEDSGTAYTEAASLGAVTASTYYYDRANQTLYVRTTGSDNPNSRFLVLTQKLYFANVPVVLPYDLATGYDVFWEPLIQTTSQFGVEIDTINQTSEAIEGSGSLTLRNDQDFWPANFDKLYFENKLCLLYSYNRMLEANEAQLIFRGRVEKRSYSASTINFGLKDTLSELRAPVPLGTIGELGLRTSSDLESARQRLVLGRVFGTRPVNTDQVLDGYPLTQSVSISYGSATLTGSGTSFTYYFSPDDRIILDGEEYTVATVNSDTSITLTENYSVVAGFSGSSIYVIPSSPRRYTNRTWKIAGHALRQPVTSVVGGSSISRVLVEDTSDIYAGDTIMVGTDRVIVDSIVGERVINLQSSLATIPPVGTTVTRPAVQNVRIDDTLLTYETDYTINPTTATLTLTYTAESNASVIRHLTSNVTVTNASKTVTGSGFKGTLKPGMYIGVAGNANFLEIASIESDTSLTARTAWGGSNTTAAGRYKPLNFDPASNILTCDVLGKTDDGTSTGTLLKTAPAIVRGLLIDAGLTALVDNTAFDSAEIAAPQHVGYVAPATYDADDAPTYREIINKVNQSVFGSLIQTSDFELSYAVLQPEKSSSALRLDESDILSMNFEGTGEKVVKTSIVKYLPKEYDYTTKKANYSTQQKTSDISNYMAKANRERTFDSVLVTASDAERAANRWAFIQENGAGRATIKTKLQAINLEVGSVIEVSHRKFFERVGLTLNSRLFLVEGVKKTGSDVTIEVVDLSNAFARTAAINTLTSTFSTATDQEKLYGGFITDSYGLIDNDPDSFDINLIW